MLITHAIPSLFNGVSQQAPSVRLPSQGEMQTNGFSSIVEGLKKRPPTDHITKLFSGTGGTAKIHTINRDNDEQYVAVIRAGSISVWDVEGKAKTVSAPNGYSYLDTPNPERDIQCVTVADHTFILNKRVTTTIEGGAGSADYQVEYVDITFLNPSTSYDYEYKVTIGSLTYTVILDNTGKVTKSGSSILFPTMGGSTSYSGVDAVVRTQSELTKKFYERLRQEFITFNVRLIDTDTVRIAAKAVGVTTPGMSAAVRQVTVNRQYIDGGDGTSTWKSVLSYSGNYSAYVTAVVATAPNPSAIKGSKQLFSSLPTTGNTVGDIWTIQGDPNNGFSAYYVKWDGGAWVETVVPGINNKPKASTMPHVLVRNADGTFTFKQAEWNQRTVGDLTTCPNPSFIGRKISGLFFYRNRLGFLSDENVVFSKAGDFFNFYRGSATVVLDDDPIDVSVSHIKVSILKHAVPFNKNLLLFSEQTQFVLTSENNLTPKTVAVHQTTEFDCSPTVTPVAAGANCYFVSESEGWAAVREYFVQEVQAINDADDVTAHVPKYIPAGVDQIEASTNEDLVLVKSQSKPKSIFAYKYYWRGDEKVQSSWSEWTFDGEVLGMSMMGSRLFLVIQYADGVYLESMSLQEGATDYGLPVQVLLDRKVRLIGTYIPDTDETEWTLPYPSANVQGVLDGVYGSNQGQILQITRPSSTKIRAKGNWVNLTVEDKGYLIIGTPYEFRYRFSPQYLKDKQGSPLARATLKLRNWSVFYDKSAYFRMEVTAVGRDTATYVFSGKRLGEAGNLLGAIATSTGKFSCPVITDATKVTVDLVNDSYLPCFVQSAEYEGFLVTRARPV